MDKKHLPIDKRLINLLHNTLRGLVEGNKGFDFNQIKMNTSYYRLNNHINILEVKVKYWENEYSDQTPPIKFNVTWNIQSINNANMFDMAKEIYNDYFRE